MSQKFVDFLKSLATDPAKVKRVEQDFDAETTAAGLTDDEKRAIRLGDAAEIRKLAGGDPQLASACVESHVSVCVLIVS